MTWQHCVFVRSPELWDQVAAWLDSIGPEAAATAKIVCDTVMSEVIGFWRANA